MILYIMFAFYVRKLATKLNSEPLMHGFAIGVVLQ